MKTKDYTKLDHPDVLRCLFHPRREGSAGTPPGAEGRLIPVDAEVSLGCTFHLTDPRAPHLLFFHGNGEIVADYDDVGPVYAGTGLNLLAVDYRGYGKSSGTPTVTAMMQDAHAVYHAALQWLQMQRRPGPLVVMGRSLGSASALELASCYASQLAGLIIESGFAYTGPLLEFLGIDTAACGIAEPDCFDHIEKIARCTQPTLIMHAEFDQFIPVSDAEALLEHSPAHRKELHIITGADHNTLLMTAGMDYFTTIKKFLSEC